MPSYIAVTGCLNPDPTQPKLAGVHPRWEINELQAKHKEQFDLLIRAWANLNARPETSSQSFYGIASIHGIPYIPWPFEEKRKPTDIDAGYCQHRSVLFPTWHRPYLLLLEQTLQQEAMVLAKQFTGNARETYVDAALKLRLPYWDWASNNSFLPRAALYDQILVAFPGPAGTVIYKRIPNPLLKYEFSNKERREEYFVSRPVENKKNRYIVPASQQQPKEKQPKEEQRWADQSETTRCPNEEGQSQHDVCDAQLARNSNVLHDAVYKLMCVDDYSSFSNTYYNSQKSTNANNYQSLEGTHDTIHVLCGIDPSPLDGHMGDVMYAGFDPLFWLHHSNVDRIYAIWQALHPGVGVSSQVRQERTMVEEAGNVQNSKSLLYPFRNRNGDFYNSEAFDKWDSIFNFGYTYPELPAKLFNKNDQGVMKAYATKCVNQAYAPAKKNYPPVPTAALIEANHMITKVPGACTDPCLTVIQKGYQLVLGEYQAFDLAADHHREYTAGIRIENFAVDGSFFVRIFLGDFNPHALWWAQETNLVGSHGVFSTSTAKTGCGNCLRDKADGVVVSGSVGLTDALLKKGLPDLEPDTVAAYLRVNLHWCVQKADGTIVENAKIPSLKVIVTCTIVETCADLEKLPVLGLPQVIDFATSSRPGGYSPGDKI